MFLLISAVQMSTGSTTLPLFYKAGLRARFGLIPLACFVSADLPAHTDGELPATAPDLPSAWTLDPVIISLFVASLALYGGGLWRMWRRAGVGRGIGKGQAASFAAGMLLLFLAMIWPLDALGEWLLSAHMAQHMLLMAVIAPLLVMGLPLVALLNALPPLVSRRLAAWINIARERPLWNRLSSMTVATGLQMATLWLWHAPKVFQAALFDTGIHTLMHASFLLTGLLFWECLLRSVRSSQLGFGAGAIALVTTMAQMGLLSALLTFAPKPLYPAYGERADAWGLTPLEDQQLAGLIMWVPAGLPYLIGGVLLFGAWLRHVEQRDRQSRRSDSQRNYVNKADSI